MPQRGARSRPDTDRLATVFGLVLAVAMVSTVAVPGLALADVKMTQFNLNGGGGDADGPDTWECEEERDSTPEDPADVALLATAAVQVCITKKTSTGCEFAATAWADTGLEAALDHGYWLRLEYDQSRDHERGTLNGLSRSADLTKSGSDATVPYGAEVRAIANIGTSPVSAVWNAYANEDIECRRA